MLPSLIYLILIVMGLVVQMYTGKSWIERTSAIIGSFIMLAILYWGGFFDKLLTAL